MILTNKILKSFLFVNLEQLNNKNVALADKMKKILNALKDPVISLNLSENVIFFNTCLIQFILTNFDENEYNTNFLLNENSKNENSEEMINNLLNEYKFGETYLNNIIANSDDNSNNFSSEFKIRILILHKIFANLSNDKSNFNGKNEYFNLLELIENPKIFLENEKFEIRGDYKFTVSQHEKIFEVSWRKSIFNQKELMIDIILNDITSVRDSQFLKADIKYRKIYLAKIAHEFKTPLNSLIYSVKQLIPKFNLDDQVENDIKFIEGQANFLSILIHDINDYCKEIDDFDINLDDIIIREILIFAFNILECLISQDNYKKDNVKLNLIIDDNLPKMIRTDEKRLKQLLVNLISNSVKFTNFGHISIIAQYNDLNEIMITVEDTGIGIKNEEQSKLFSEYSDINKEYFKLNKNGTGLGLSICKKIIQKLGGILKCESDSHLTKFYFTLNNPKEDLLNEENIVNQMNSEENNTIIMKSYLLKNEEINKYNDILSNNEVSNPKLSIQQDNSIKLEIKSHRLKQKSSSQKEMMYYEKESLIETLEELLNDKENRKLKSNFLNFNRPLIKYMKHIMNNNDESLKFILIVDDELMNINSLSLNLKKFMKEKRIKNVKVIKLRDGIEALNLLYYDIIFFLKVHLVISDLNMKFMNGDLLYKTLNNLTNNLLRKINFSLYTNTDKETLSHMGLSNIYLLNKPCEKYDLEKIFTQFELFI